MSPTWRNPLLAIGVVLLVIGTGNTLVSRNKISQYSARPSSESKVEDLGDLRDLPHLTPRTNQMLLEHLHRDLSDYTFVAAKLDFYRVIQTGGQFLSWIGLLCIAIVFVHARLRIRSRRNRSLSPSHDV